MLYNVLSSVQVETATSSPLEKRVLCHYCAARLRHSTLAKHANNLNKIRTHFSFSQLVNIKRKYIRDEKRVIKGAYNEVKHT